VPKHHATKAHWVKGGTASHTANRTLHEEERRKCEAFSKYCLRNAIFWDIAPCTPYVSRRFGVKHHLYPLQADFRPWRWTSCVSPKRRFTYVLNRTIFQKMVTFIGNMVSVVFLSHSRQIVDMQRTIFCDVTPYSPVHQQAGSDYSILLRNRLLLVTWLAEPSSLKTEVTSGEVSGHFASCLTHITQRSSRLDTQVVKVLPRVTARQETRD
jgi:hypothetical protein